MSKGLISNNSNPRCLEINNRVVAVGGEIQNGLLAKEGKLYFDNNLIAEPTDIGIGLHIKDGEVYFGNVKICRDNPTHLNGLWIPPVQKSSVYTPYDYNGLINKYDELGKSNPTYVKKVIYEEKGQEGYDLIHYIFTPKNYTKTYILVAGHHGNEHDAPQTLLRIMEILCNETDKKEYNRLKPLRDNVRIICVPCVCPSAYNKASMNTKYVNMAGDDVFLNPNRNYDYNHQYGIPQAGTGGDYPEQIAEVRHIANIVENTGKENIDFFVDFHDGGDVKQHLWLRFNMDSIMVQPTLQLVSDLIDYEEKNFPQYKDPGNGWLTDNCCDNGGYSTGVCAAWVGCSCGILSGACEYIGGFFGYDFSAEQMTRSLRIRANYLLYMYEKIHIKPWAIDEKEDDRYFHFDFPVSMTRKGLRKDPAATAGIVSFSDVYKRWNTLYEKYSNYVSKSQSLGKNSSGNDIYAYTLGNGNKKVLFIGGMMRWSSNHKETEFGMYILAEYLCNDYIVSQSRFLQDLKNNYTICILPCIDISGGGNNPTGRTIGLNCMASPYSKWQIVNGKCIPTAHGELCEDVQIFKSFINSNKDAQLIISGGEDTSGYLYEYPKYTIDYMTQFILPLNQETNISSYSQYLQKDRGEEAPVIEHTDGKTSADYAFDNFGIPTIYMNLHVSNKWDDRKQYAQASEREGNGDSYFYRNYETGRRIANIVNLFLIK